MFSESTPYLITIYENIDKVLLIFARIAGFIYLIPVFSGTNTPTRVKIGFSFIIAVVIFSTGVANDVAVADNAIAYAVILSKEILTGLCLSFVVYTFFTAFYFAGQMMDYSIGFSMVSVFDPITQIQVPITGNMLYYIMTIMFIRTGGLNSLLATLFESFRLIPIGTTNFALDEGLMLYLVEMTSTYIELGFRIAAPIICTILVVDVALGILVKASPQMNVFVVGMPIKLLVGLVVLYLICPYFIDVYNEVYLHMFNAVNAIIGGMSY